MWNLTWVSARHLGCKFGAGLCIAALPALVALPATAAPHAAAATIPLADEQPQQAHSIVGSWTISGDTGDEKFTITFNDDKSVTITTSENNTVSGLGWSYADDTITYDGSTSINKLNVSGKWKVKWNGKDEFKATDDGGHHYILARTAMKK